MSQDCFSHSSCYVQNLQCAASFPFRNIPISFGEGNNFLSSCLIIMWNYISAPSFQLSIYFLSRKVSHHGGISLSSPFLLNPAFGRLLPYVQRIVVGIYFYQVTFPQKSKIFTYFIWQHITKLTEVTSLISLSVPLCAISLHSLPTSFVFKAIITFFFF